MMWTSSDSGVVRMMGTPSYLEVVFRAVAPGDAWVSATLNGRMGRARLHVEPSGTPPRRME
jgi:hypothetical protein